MKYSILCFLFGHRFVHSTGWQFSKTHFGVIEKRLFPMNWCQRCGLTKEEVGITRSANN